MQKVYMQSQKENQTNEKKICIMSDNMYRYDFMYVLKKSQSNF